jgi:hypothetical protein
MLLEHNVGATAIIHEPRHFNNPHSPRLRHNHPSASKAWRRDKENVQYKSFSFKASPTASTTHDQWEPAPPVDVNWIVSSNYFN